MYGRYLAAPFVHVCVRDVAIVEELFHNARPRVRGGGLGSSTIFKKFNEPYAPS